MFYVERQPMTTLAPSPVISPFAVVVAESPARKIHLELEILKREGLLVDLSIRGTTLFQRSLSWLETGIAEYSDDPRVTQFTKGQKFVWRSADVKELKSVEVALRTLLDKYSRRVDGFAPYRWLPAKAYTTWREKHDALVARGEEIKARMMDTYADVVDEISAAYADIAELAWRSIASTAGVNYVILENKKNGEQVPFDRERFVSYVVESTVAAIPTREEIEQKVIFDYVTALIESEGDIALDQAEAERIRAEARVQRDLSNLEVSAKEEEVRAKSWMIQAAQREKEIQIAAMREAEMEHARKQLREMTSPFDEIFLSLRNQFAKDAEELLKSVRQNGFVHGKVAERGRGLLEMYDLLAVQDDTKLRERLLSLKQALGPLSGEKAVRSTAQVTALLEEIMELEKSAAADLLAGPDQFSLLDVL
jgi:hypothetical protein